VTVPDPNPLADCDVIVFQGGATLFDRQLASTIYCVDDEIIKCSKRRERRMRDVMPQTTSLNWQTAYNISYELGCGRRSTAQKTLGHR
jgi:hypothetical protein